MAPSSSAQAEVLAALPALHRTAWRTLGLLCALCGSVMLPLLLPACRLVNEHLRRWGGRCERRWWRAEAGAEGRWLRGAVRKRVTEHYVLGMKLSATNT